MFCEIIIKANLLVKKCYRHFVRIPYLRKQMEHMGNKVAFPQDFSVTHPQNMWIGDDVSFGEGFRALNALATIRVNSHVMFGPGVTVVTGNHRIDVVGKYMTEVTNADKFDEVNGAQANPYDAPVIFEGDNWIGANVTILKGVTIGKGSVIAAGAVINKDVPPYEIWGGVPARCIGKRFTEEQIALHEKIMQQRNT